MIYEITVFKLMGNKRQRIFSKGFGARDATQALEKACVTLKPERIIEIRMIENPIDYPRVSRPGRDGV